MSTNVKYSKLQAPEKEEKSVGQRRRNCIKTMLKSAVIFTLLAVLLAVCSSIFVDGFSFSKLSYPMHASCKIDWTFDMNCSSVSQAIADQIKTWHGPDNCKQGGEKCLYELKFMNSTKISGTHKTPVKEYVDDISFDFSSSENGCAVFGFSTSETWYAYLDYGTNYCNLHNLITGSKLDKSAGYTEKTSDSVCTQYTSRDCDKY